MKVALDCLAKCVAALEGDTGAVLAFGQTRFFEEDGTLLDVYGGDFSVTAATPSERFEFVCRNLVLNNAQNALIRLDVLRKTALDRLYPHGDPVLMAELALHGRWHLLPEVLLYRRTGREHFTPQRTLAEITRIYDPLRTRPMALIIWRRHFDYCTVALDAPIPWGERVRTMSFACGRAFSDRRTLFRDLRAFARSVLFSQGLARKPLDSNRVSAEVGGAPVAGPPQ